MKEINISRLVGFILVKCSIQQQCRFPDNFSHGWAGLIFSLKATYFSLWELHNLLCKSFQILTAKTSWQNWETQARPHQPSWKQKRKAKHLSNWAIAQIISSFGWFNQILCWEKYYPWHRFCVSPVEVFLHTVIPFYPQGFLMVENVLSSLCISVK